VPGSLKIALLLEPNAWSSRQLIDGIMRYASEHGPWRFVFQEFTADGVVDKWLLRSAPDGVLAGITSRTMAKKLRRLGVPIVDIFEEHATAYIPQIVCDDREVIRLAVDHLRDRGIRRFAFVGSGESHVAHQRRKWFNEYVQLQQQRSNGSARKGQSTCHALMLPGEPMACTHGSLADWLRSAPTPLGVVACNDAWAALVLRACNESDLSVPDDIAVIGVDDDPVFCHLGDPPLSSINCNSHEIGYRAAAMVHGMIAHGDSPPPVTFVPPAGVESRKSTDRLAISDQDVVAAVRYVQDHVGQRLSTHSVASAFGVSRRTLERMFTKHLGHSPAAEISRVKLERVRELLSSTVMPLTDIVKQTGFSHVETLHRLFKKRFGLSPGGYRRAHQHDSQSRPGQPVALSTARRRRKPPLA